MSFIHNSDELPVQLTLPRALREAPNRQQLSSLALLGQEFWRYPMANPKPTSSGPSPTQASSATKSDSSGIGTTVFSTHQQKIITTSHTTIGAVFSPTTPHGIFSQAGTPSDTTSSLSSFTSTGHQMMSPESADSVLLTMSPVESTGRNGIFGKTSTFKTQNRKSMDVEKVSTFMGGNLNGSQSSHNINLNNNMDNGNIRAVRPTPPSTLNLGPLRIPPAPPPRWAKPTTPTSPNDSSSNESRELTNNFTVTTTVTFSVDGNQNQQIMEVLSPNANTTVIQCYFAMRCATFLNAIVCLFNCSSKQSQNAYRPKANARHLVIHFHLRDRNVGKANPAKIPVKTIAKFCRRIRRTHRMVAEGVEANAAAHVKNQNITRYVRYIYFSLIKFDNILAFSMPSTDFCRFISASSINANISMF